MPDHRRRRFILVLGAVLIAVWGVPLASAQDLSSADADLINNLLGDGVLGAAVKASPIADPQSLLPLTPSTRTFQFVSGPNEGTSETDVVKANTQPGAPTPWQYAAGKTTIYNIGTSGDGSIVSPSEQDLSQGVVTKYDPPRTLLVKGMKPGEKQSTTLKVSVFNIGDPGTVSHSGSLTLTVTHLGRYQVKVPAGTYPATLIKLDYNGEIGPASVSDFEYQFFADGVGPVAVIEKESVSAFLVYNKHTKDGKVLSSAGK
jgi:hypothetical protein